MALKNISKSFSFAILIGIVLPIFLSVYYFFGFKNERLSKDPNYFTCPGSGGSYYVKKADDTEVLEYRSHSQENFRKLGVLQKGVLTFEYSNQTQLEETRFALNQACKNSEGKVLFDSITEVVEKESK